MRQDLTRLLFVLTVFITAEIVGMNSFVVSHDALPAIAITEWVETNNLRLFFEKAYFKTHSDPGESASIKAICDKILFFPLQGSFYREKLHLNDIYTFVFSRICRSNIPHLNQDDEDPAFILV
jgi:hypothetical protein